ncbi:MAG: putative quinol monooxygenase [Chloroflexota bacterium]
MYVLIVTWQVKQEHHEEWLAAALRDASSSVQNEPGCQRFDVLQDNADPNRVYFYEVYADEEAFSFHQQQPHYLRWRTEAKDWHAAPPVSIRAHNVYPSDVTWPRIK